MLRLLIKPSLNVRLLVSLFLDSLGLLVRFRLVVIRLQHRRAVIVGLARGRRRRPTV